MNIDELEKLAKEATPGKWSILDDMPFDVEVSCGNYCQGGTGYIDLGGGKKATYTDLLFMTKANPETVLKLVQCINDMKELVDVCEETITNHDEVWGSCSTCLSDGRGTHAEQIEFLINKIKKAGW